MAVQVTYSPNGSSHSHSRQSSSEHLPVDNDPTQLHSSFFHSSAGPSADPTPSSGGGSPYTGGFSATSPMAPSLVSPSPIDQQYSQSPHFGDHTTSMSIPRSRTPGIDHPMPSVDSRSASSMSNHLPPSSAQNGSGCTSVAGTSAQPTSPPLQVTRNAAFESGRAHATGSSPVQGNFDSGGVRVHGAGEANEIPEIRVTGMSISQEQFASLLWFPNNSSQQSTLMAALGLVFTITRFRMSGTHLQRGFMWLSTGSHT